MRFVHREFPCVASQCSCGPFNGPYAGLRHAIVVATKSHSRVKRIYSIETEACAGNNNSVTYWYWYW